MSPLHKLFSTRASLQRGVAGLIGAGLLIAASSQASASTAVPTPSSASSAPSAKSGAAAAPATPRATFGVVPVTLGKTDARGYFSYQMGKGGSYSDRVAVVNYGPTALALTVYAADLGNALDGSISVGQPTRYDDAGGWVKLAQPKQVVTVPAVNAKTGPGRVVLPFRIVVPFNALPGDHGAAIVAVLSTLGKNAKSENVLLNQRLAARIYLRVAGPLHPSLTVQKLKVSYHGTANPIGTGTATVRYVLRNTGNVRLGAQQAVDVSSIFGAKSKLATPAAVPLLFPGSQQTVTVKVTGVPVRVLDKARVSVTPTEFSDQAPVSVNLVKATKSFHAIPWTLLAIMLAIIVAFGGWLWRRRRSHRGPAAPPGRSRHSGSGPKDPRGPVDSQSRIHIADSETVPS